MCFWPGSIRLITTIMAALEPSDPQAIQRLESKIEDVEKETETWSRTLPRLFRIFRLGGTK